MTRVDGLVSTGNGTMDEALGGGLPQGSVYLLEGEEGAGSTEFAASVLRAAAGSGEGRRARFASALRSITRIERELGTLFEDPKEASLIEARQIRPRQAQSDCMLALSDCGAGDVLVIESASALLRAEAGRDLAGLLQNMGDMAAELEAVVLLLSAPRTVPADVEAALGEAADGVLCFSWRDGGNNRRRILNVPKLRGLAPALDGEQIPVFEIALQRGIGFSLSSVKSVV